MAASENPQRSTELLDLDKALDIGRFPRSLWWALVLVLYTPLGLLLTLLRLCLSLQALIILMVLPEGGVKRLFLRIFCTVLGIVVVTEDFHRQSGQTKLFVGNRLSHIDHIVYHLALNCITVSTHGLSPPFSYFFPHHTFAGRDEGTIAEEAVKLPEFDTAKSVVDCTPYVIQPEATPTNGKHAVLKFSLWPFDLEEPVQPITLRAVRPLGIKLTTVGSNGWWDLLWTLFVPCTVFTVKMLCPMDINSGEDSQDFSQRVRRCFADELELETSDASDKHIEKWLTDPPLPPPPPPTPPPTESQGPIISETEFDSLPNSSSSSSLSEMETRVRQVMAVLPQVPHISIRKDLMKTNSVDVTITNILEGRVEYDPVATLRDTPVASSHSGGGVHQRASARGRGNDSGESFGSSALSSMQRTLSLEERKRNLLEDARRRYIEKHGLQQKS